MKGKKGRREGDREKDGGSLIEGLMEEAMERELGRKGVERCG